MERTIGKVTNKVGQWIIFCGTRKIGTVLKTSNEYRVAFDGGFARYFETKEQAMEVARSAETGVPKQRTIPFRPAPVSIFDSKKTAKKKTTGGGKPTLYFAYGANTDREAMKYRCPTAKAIAAGTLNGWQLEFRGCADIVQVEGASVHGALWLIFPDDEASLDGFEGFPYSYVKQVVPIQCEGRTVDAMVYIMTDRRRTGRGYVPSAGYYNTLARGYAHFGIDKAQIEDAVRRAALDMASSLITNEGGTT